MNDPHVETLTYEMRTNEDVVIFDNPPALTGEEDAFRYRLDGGNLTVEMKEHHATAESARSAVEDYLKAWEINAALSLDRMAMRFVFKEAHQIDRNPPPQELGKASAVAHLTLGSLAVSGTGVVMTLSRKKYPDPPSGFKASPDVETLWTRYERHIEGKEPRQAMGYFCLTVIECIAGPKEGDKRGTFKRRARDKAADVYNIESSVLYKLGELTSETRGTPLDARKRKAGTSPEPLTAAEQEWIKEAVKMLIRRKGEYDHDPDTASSLKQITMSVLPPL